MLSYSPEYVAMCESKAAGTEVVFMDLPHHALLKPNVPKEEKPPEEKGEEVASGGAEGWEHLFAESSFYRMLAEVGGYRTWEEAWDAIFESGPRLADREGPPY